jgi:hypothetical protein
MISLKTRRHHNNKGVQGNKSGSRFRELLDSFKKYRKIKISKKY